MAQAGDTAVVLAGSPPPPGSVSAFAHGGFSARDAFAAYRPHSARLTRSLPASRTAIESPSVGLIALLCDAPRRPSSTVDATLSMAE